MSVTHNHTFLGSRLDPDWGLFRDLRFACYRCLWACLPPVAVCPGCAHLACGCACPVGCYTVVPYRNGGGPRFACHHCLCACLSPVAVCPGCAPPPPACCRAYSVGCYTVVQCRPPVVLDRLMEHSAKGYTTVWRVAGERGLLRGPASLAIVACAPVCRPSRVRVALTLLADARVPSGAARCPIPSVSNR
jgi:hypothetical protein